MLKAGTYWLLWNGLVDGSQLPCQKPKGVRDPFIQQKGHWLSGLRNKLSISAAESPNAAKAAADSCCGNKPYSSATSQCCIGRVIPLSEICCLNGKTVHHNQDAICTCSAPPKWSKIENERLVKMIEVWNIFNNFLKLSIVDAEADEENYKQQIFELDQKGGHLIQKFADLVGLEVGDPEITLIEHQILNPEPSVRRDRRVRVRRNINYRNGFQFDEYVPPHYLPEYEYAEEIEPSFDTMYMDYIPKEIETDYEEEPDEDEAHIRQVHQIILEREKIREKMKNLGVDHIQKIENLEKLQKTKIALLAAKAPVQNSRDLILSQIELASELEDQSGGHRCQLHSWDEHIHTLIKTFNTALDSTKQIVDPLKLENIQNDILNITYFHQNWKREYSAYEEYEEEDDELYK